MITRKIVLVEDFEFSHFHFATKRFDTIDEQRDKHLFKDGFFLLQTLTATG